MRPALLAAAFLAGLGASRAAAAPATVSFAVDSRVELLSVVLMLSAPADFKSRRPDGLDAYAAAAEAAFSKFSGHPAVARVAGLLGRGVPASALVRAVLAPGDGDADGLRADLRDFEKASGFDRFFEAHREQHQAFSETARRESLHAISPESALAYMGLTFTGDQRFILAPLLSDDAGEFRVRAGTSRGGAIEFRFETFEGSAAAELCRAAVNWGPSGDIPAHVAAAVGLRVLAEDLGERVYRAALRRLASERLPRLEAVSEGLKEYESDRHRYPTLQSFSPRLEALAAPRLEQTAFPAGGDERAAALALLAETRARNPDLDTRRRLVFLYQDLKEDAQAKSLADELLKSYPDNSAVQLDHAAWAAKAGARLKDSEREAALKDLAEARGRTPSFDERRLMATQYQERGDAAQAQALLGELISAAPGDPRLRVDRAALAVRAGDRDAALRSLGEARALGPDPDERRRMALLYQDLKDYPSSAALLARLAREQPENAALLGDLGLCTYLNGQQDAAIEELKAALKLNAASLAAAITLGSIYAEQRRFDLELAVYDAVPPGGGELELRLALLRRRQEALKGAPAESSRLAK